VGNDHELVQGLPTEDGIYGEVDLLDVEDGSLRVVVLRHPKGHQEREATVLENGCEGAILDIGIYNFSKAARLMRLRDAPPSTIMWYNLTLAMAGETSSWSCLAPAMFLGQSEVLKLIDVSIHLWWGAVVRRRCSRPHRPAQCLDDSPGHDVLGAPVHHMERLAMLVSAGVGVVVGHLCLTLGILVL
jgi:hypothetical protein